MQPPTRQGVPVGLALFLVLGGVAVGCIIGAFAAYNYVSQASRSEPSFSVPQSKDFGKATFKSTREGWWETTFPDLDLAALLPCKVIPKDRKFTASAAQQVTETADYSGHSPAATWQLGAFWGNYSSYDPVAIVRFNLSRTPEWAARAGLKYDIRSSKVDNHPACEAEGTYFQGGAVRFHMLYISNGNGIYYVENNFWEWRRTLADAEWSRSIASIHFLGKAPIDR